MCLHSLSLILSGISPNVIAYHLKVQPQFEPVRQKKRCRGQDRQKTAEEEVDKLLQVRFSQEIMYP